MLLARSSGWRTAQGLGWTAVGQRGRTPVAAAAVVTPVPIPLPRFVQPLSTSGYHGWFSLSRRPPPKSERRLPGEAHGGSSVGGGGGGGGGGRGTLVLLQPTRPLSTATALLHSSKEDTSTSTHRPRSESTVSQHPPTAATSHAGADCDTPDDSSDADDDDDGSELHHAVSCGDADTVRTLLAHGANPSLLSTPADSSMPLAPPLATAALRGNREIVQLLLEAGAAVDGRMPVEAPWALRFAMNAVGRSIPRGLAKLEARAESHTPLAIATLCTEASPRTHRAEHLGVMRLLINAGARLSGRPLLYASGLPNTAALRLLLDSGANPDGTPGQWLSPLAVAAGSGELEAVRLLLSVGATPDSTTTHTTRGTPLLCAANRGSLAVVNELLAVGADPEGGEEGIWSAVSVAAGRGHVDVVERLIAAGVSTASVDAALLAASVSARPAAAACLVAAGADVDAEGGSTGATPLTVVFSNPNADNERLPADRRTTAAVLLEGGADPNLEGAHGTPLLLAAREGCEATVAALLEAGAEVDKECYNEESTTHGFTPLYEAAGLGHTEVVTLLLDAGANPYRHTSAGHSPLHVAAMEGHLTTVAALEQHMPLVDIHSDTGSTPAMMAAESGRCDVVQFLFGSGADLDVSGGNGVTALHMAAINNHPAMVSVLWLLGVRLNPETREPEGCTPLIWAAALGHTEAVQQLVAVGADLNWKSGEGLTALQYAELKDNDATARVLRQALFR